MYALYLFSSMRPELQIQCYESVCNDVRDGRMTVTKGAQMAAVRFDRNDLLWRSKIHSHELKQRFKACHVDELALAAEDSGQDLVSSYAQSVRLSGWFIEVSPTDSFHVFRVLPAIAKTIGQDTKCTGQLVSTLHRVSAIKSTKGGPDTRTLANCTNLKRTAAPPIFQTAMSMQYAFIGSTSPCRANRPITLLSTGVS